jgi:hypothetical protein
MAELESVKLSLVEQQPQQLFPIHCTNPSTQIPWVGWFVHSVYRPEMKADYGSSVVE